MHLEHTENIVQTEKKIHDLNIRISNLKDKSIILKFLFLKRLERKCTRLEAVQFNAVDKFLAISNPAYQKIIEENYALLTTSNIEFIVYQHDYLLYGTYTSKVEGQIHSNGCSYSHATGSNFEIIPFDSLKYTAEMKGTVDYWGNLKLKTTKTKMAIFKTLPKKFKGKIDAQGLIHIKNIENEWDIVSGGKFAMGKLIANHFDYDEIKKQTFFDNKLQLKDMISEYRKNLQLQL